MSRVFSVPFTTLLRERGGRGHGLIRNNKGAFVNDVACKCDSVLSRVSRRPPRVFLNKVVPYGGRITRLIFEF